MCVGGEGCATQSFDCFPHCAGVSSRLLCAVRLVSALDGGTAPVRASSFWFPPSGGVEELKD